MLPAAEFSVFCSVLVQMTCPALFAVCMRTQPEPFSPGRNLCYLTVRSLSHLCHFGHGQKWMEKFSAVLLREIYNDICFDLAYIENVLIVENTSLDFGQVDFSLPFDSYSVSIFFISEVIEVTSTSHNEQYGIL